MKIIDKTQQYDDAILYGTMLGKIMFIIADKVYTSVSFLIDKNLGEKQDLLTAYFMELVERRLKQEATLSEYYDDAKRLYEKYQEVIDPNSKKNPSLITGKEALGVMCLNSIKIILEQLNKVSTKSTKNTPWHEKWFYENELTITTWWTSTTGPLNDEGWANWVSKHEKPFRNKNLSLQPYFDPSPGTGGSYEWPKQAKTMEGAANFWSVAAASKFTHPPGASDAAYGLGGDIDVPKFHNKLLWQRFLKIKPTDKPNWSDLQMIAMDTAKSGEHERFNLKPALYSSNLTGHVNIYYWEAAWKDFITKINNASKTSNTAPGGKFATHAAKKVYASPQDLYDSIEYGVRAVYLCDKAFYNEHKDFFSIKFGKNAGTTGDTMRKKSYKDAAYNIGNYFLIPIAEVTRPYDLSNMTIPYDKSAPDKNTSGKAVEKFITRSGPGLRVKTPAQIDALNAPLNTQKLSELKSLQKELLETNEMRALTEYIFPYHLLPQMSAIYCIESLSNALMSLTAGGGVPSVIVNAGLDALINKIRYSGVYMKNE